jgi:hypothetical protein
MEPSGKANIQAIQAMKKQYFILVFAVTFLGQILHAQQSLSDLVQEANAGWMIGSWKATTDDGGTFSMTFSWDLDKHVIVLHGKGDDLEFKGYSALQPGTDQVSYFGFDNRGVVSQGKWSMENDELTLRVESQTDEGVRKMAAVFVSGSGGGLVVRLHRLDDSGDLISPEQQLLRFTKN